MNINLRDYCVAVISFWIGFILSTKVAYVPYLKYKECVKYASEQTCFEQTLKGK